MPEKERKPDRRVIKTKKAIRNAFAKLLCEKDIDKITIKDIADTADINRKTFYNYYNGVYQIIDEIENEIIETLEASIEGLAAEEYLKNPYKIFDKITEAISQDMEFYENLLKMNTNLGLFQKIVDLLKEHIKEAVLDKVSIDRDRLNVMIEYTISGMIAAYKSWFKSDRHLTLQEISDVMARLWYDGISVFMKDYLPESV